MMSITNIYMKLQKGNVKKMDEQKLIKQVRDKSHRASANLLIKNYYKEIYLYIYKQAGKEELAKDLTQEVFISMLISISNYDFTRASFRTWLYKIASNKLVDYYRSKSYKHSTKIIDLDGIEIRDSKDIEEEAIQKEHIKEIIEIVNNLTSNYQYIFRLKVFGEMTFKEIGFVLQISESTVKTRYYKIIKSIKQELSHEE